MKSYSILYIFLFFGFTFLVKSQEIENDIKFKHFSSSNGLSQRSITSILQDKKGYIWFGTRDGLNKFDGHKFTVYKHLSGDTTSLSHNSIHSIYEDSFGNLWIGTHEGLNKFNPEKNNFTQYKSTNSRNSISDNIIWGLIQLDNTLFVATSNGVSVINIITNSISNFIKNPKNPNSLSDNTTRSFLKSNDGNLWICNINYIDIYNPLKKTFEHLDYPKENNKYFINDLPTLFQDSNNSIWLGHGKGLALFNKKTRVFEDYMFQNKKAIITAVRSICEDLSGKLWIGSYSGLYILNKNKTSLKHIVHEDNKPNSLSQNSIYKIIRDSRGDIWIGTWADGINYFNRDNGIFKHISYGKSNNSLNYRVLSGITEDANGNFWIGTEGGGVNFLNSNTRKFTYYKNIPENSTSLTADNVKSVITGRDGNIWIGIHNGGVNFINPNKFPLRFESIDFPKTSNYSLKVLKVLNLFEDKNGNIWIGTLNGGLIFYNKKTKIILKLDTTIKSVMCIVASKNPDFLIVGGDKGLEKININTLKKHKIQLINNLDKENSSTYVNCVFIDKYDNYWIGTEGQGLYNYNPKTNKTKVYGIIDGLPNDIIYGILPDNNNNIWLSTNFGISRLNIKSNAIKNYDQTDGLQGNEFNYGSFYKSKNGILYFGGTNGITYFNPVNIQKNTFVPIVDIYNIEVNNMPFSKITDATKKIVLKHYENDFSIDFTALSFIQSDKNQFAYKLEGRDTKWNYVGNNRRAVYTNIDNGNYVFRVKASNNYGVWNEVGDSVEIKIQPAPWKSWWAFLIYILVICSGIIYIRKLIITRIKEKDELKSERLEKKRIEEVNQMKLKLFTDVSHDFRTPLTLIIGPLEKMISEKVGNKYVQQQHKVMNRNAKILLQLINEILDFRKSESGKMSLKASKNNIVLFVKDVKQSFSWIAEKKNINFIFNTTDENIEVWFDKLKFEKIVLNLLSNAFKFANENSDLIINISKTQKRPDFKFVEYVKIDVINFGKTISKNQINLVFDRFYQVDSEEQIGSGIGLSLAKSLVELHKGEIDVRSSETKGTYFTVFLRLGNDHLTEEQCVNEIESNIDVKFSESLNLVQNEVSNKVKYDELADYVVINELKSILVVEDNIDVQNFVKEIFINKYNIFTANNGEQAILIAHQKSIDLIISDVSMPIMNGFELCKNIKTNIVTSHIPVILLTAKTSQIYQEKGYKTGADSYITKPFKSDVLESIVDNLLKSRENLIRKFKKDIILNAKDVTITSTDEIFLEKAISIVENNITNPSFNTNMFVEKMNMSRTVLYTKLKFLTGQNLSTFIRTIKLKRASQLILQTDMNISEIAYEVGFIDLKYFRKCFKDLFKVLPSEYRENSTQ